MLFYFNLGWYSVVLIYLLNWGVLKKKSNNNDKDLGRYNFTTVLIIIIIILGSCKALCDFILNITIKHLIIIIIVVVSCKIHLKIS